MSRLPGIASVSVLLLMAAPGWSADNEGRALLEKVARANGGWERLGKARAVLMKLEGQLHQKDAKRSFTGEVAFQLPDRLRIRMEVPVRGGKATVTQILRGEEGWFNTGTRGPYPMRPSEIAEVRQQLHTSAVTRLGVLADKSYRFTLVPDIRIKERPAVGLLVSHGRDRDIRLYFDKETLLLVKSQTRGRDAGGGPESVIETFYEDHKKVNGIPEPHRIRIHRDKEPYLEANITSIKIAEKLADKLFERPR